jgi:hypothetical protein
LLRIPDWNLIFPWHLSVEPRILAPFMDSHSSTNTATFLGIETGATHSSVILVDGNDAVLQRLDLGPANVKLLSNVEITRLFRQIRQSTGFPTAIAAGMAGLRNENDRQRITELAHQSRRRSKQRVHGRTRRKRGCFCSVALAPVPMAGTQPAPW